MPRQSSNTLDQVAENLAFWLDDIGTQLAEALMAGGSAPFAAQITEAEKRAYYPAQLFNPDGSPNMQGRAHEMQRLGPEGFATMFKAVAQDVT